MLTLLMTDAQGNRGPVVFNSISTELDVALRSGGVPVQLDNWGNVTHQYSLTQFMGGWLLDDCPLNVVMFHRWDPGQIEAAKQAGLRPSCPECQYGTGCYEDFYGRPATTPTTTTAPAPTGGPLPEYTAPSNGSSGPVYGGSTFPSAPPPSNVFVDVSTPGAPGAAAPIAEAGMFGGDSTPWLIGGAVLAYMLLSKKKRG